MSQSHDAKLQQIVELFQAGDYEVDPTLVAGSVIRRMSIPRDRQPAAPGRGGSLGHLGGHRVRGIVSVDRGRARVAAF